MLPARLGTTGAWQQHTSSIAPVPFAPLPVTSSMQTHDHRGVHPAHLTEAYGLATPGDRVLLGSPMPTGESS